MKQVFLLIFIFILITCNVFALPSVNVGSWHPEAVSGFYVNVGVDATYSDEIFATKYNMWNELDGEYSAYMKFGDDDFIGDEHSIVLGNNDPSIPDGAITHHLYTQENKTIEAWQSGLNNSWGFHKLIRNFFR